MEDSIGIKKFGHTFGIPELIGIFVQITFLVILSLCFKSIAFFVAGFLLLVILFSADYQASWLIELHYRISNLKIC